MSIADTSGNGINYIYTQSDSEITLTGMTIPVEGYNGYTGSLTATLPDSITKLNTGLANGIQNRSRITHLIIGSQVTTFGNNMFNGWSGLTSVTINSKKISEFEYDNFTLDATTAMTSDITITSFSNSPIVNLSLHSETNVNYLCMWLFNFTNHTTNIKNVTIIEGSTFIEEYCFDRMFNVTQVTIPNSITEIREGAFSRCRRLQTFNLPSPPALLGDGSFRLNDEFAEKIPSSVVNSFIAKGYRPANLLNAGFAINDFFYDITDGVIMHLRISLALTNSIGGELLIVNTVTSNQELPTLVETRNKVLSIAFEPTSIFTRWNSNSGLQGSTYLTSITFPNSLTTIGPNSFSGCSYLTSLVLPGSNGIGLATLGANAFSGTNVPQSSLQTMLDQGYGYENLVAAGFRNVPVPVLVPVLVPDINNNGIEYTYTDSGSVIRLTGMTIPTVSNLTATLPDNITYLSDGLASNIQNCSNITKLIIGPRVTTFGSGMFNGWSGLTYVTINSKVISTFNYTGFRARPSTLITIDITSFSNSFINTIEVYSDINIYFFFFWFIDDNLNILKNIIIKDGSTLITQTFFHDLYITSITIPNSVTNIGQLAFQGCNSLTSFNLPIPPATLGLNSFSLSNELHAVKISSSVVNNFIEDGYTRANLMNAGFYINDFLYDVTNGVMTDLSCRENGGELLIVNTVTSNGLLRRTGEIENTLYTNKVLSIVFEADSIFTTWNSNSGLAGSAYLTSIIFPNSLTTIGPNSFSGCSNLTSVVLPGSQLVTLGANAFFGTNVSQSSLQHMRNQGYSKDTLEAAGFTNVPTDTVTPIICFNEGTKILCFIDGQEKEILIQNIRNGHLVKTLYDGYKPVCMIGTSVIYNPGTVERFKNRLFICKKEKYLELNEDLIITGCHSILVDEITTEQRQQIIVNMGRIFITDRKYRLNAVLDDRAEPYNCPGKFNIYHIALENKNYYSNYGIYANGLLVESCGQRAIKEFANMSFL